MKISEILKPEFVSVPLNAIDKTSAITELVDLLARSGQLTDRDEVLRAVLAREKTRSTGIGRGLAVPHGKSHACKTLAMAVGKPSEPLDFQSSDGQPVEIVVLLTSPLDKTGPHIQMLACVSRLWLSDAFRSAVASATTADALYGAIKRYEA